MSLKVNCCVPGCNKRYAMGHVIPKDPGIQRVWLERIGDATLFDQDEKALKRLRVCGAHFEWLCVSKANGKLLPGALPTLELPGYIRVPEDTFAHMEGGVSRGFNTPEGIKCDPIRAISPELVVRTPVRVYSNNRETLEKSQPGPSLIIPKEEKEPTTMDRTFPSDIVDRHIKSEDVSDDLNFSVELVSPKVEKLEEPDEQTEPQLNTIHQMLYEAQSYEMPKNEDMNDSEEKSADDIVKDPGLIEASQKDIRTTDVLVCGRCHKVFHFIEEFLNHKSQICTAKSTVVPVCENESEPQLWGFTLWKNKFIRSLDPNEEVPSSWVIYQKWCELAPIDKDVWILAGQKLQYCNEIGTKKIIDEKEEGSGFTNESNKENVVDNSPTQATRSIVHDKPTDPSVNKALQTHSEESNEFDVERIIALHFNPKEEYWEYQIKWEHLLNENTWEPVMNQIYCREMVEEFEAHLIRLDMEKAKQQQETLTTETSIMKKNLVPSSSIIDYTDYTHDVSYVAQCSGNSDTPSRSKQSKRKMDDSKDSFKKIMLKDWSRDSSDQNPS